MEITLPNGEKQTFDKGTTVAHILSETGYKLKNRKIVGALVDNNAVSLSFRVETNSTIKPLTLDDRTGTDIYRRSLSFLLTIASKEIFPNRRLIIGHSLGRGYFYYFDGINNIDQKDLKLIEEKMRELVKQDIPIERDYISYLEAIQYFRTNKQADTALLLENRNDPQIPIYRCGKFLDLAHSPLVPSTGFLRVFEIMNYPPGFLLRYPPFRQSNKMAPFQENHILFSIYQEYKNWGKILQISSVGALNKLINSGEVSQFIQVSEALHNKKIAEIADKICERRDSVKIVLIAGPSSSGKTTFSKKLAIQLRVLGRNPITISLDDYFLPRELTPKDENGNYNFEALEALDIDLLNRHLIDILNGKEVKIPDFDFHTGQRKPQGKPFKLPKRGILIMEGIHGLNDKLTPLVERDRKYKIYVSALTQLNIDDHNRISTTDNRLIRRLVRDYKFRGHSALTTLSMWHSVRRGEHHYIFPFQNEADSAFNSALDYELAVLKVYAEPLLKTVKPDKTEYNEARRLLNFLDNFSPLPSKWVPSQSILREFIGDSAFKY